MYTNHFYSRMSERIFKNEKKLNNKEYKSQNKQSKQILTRALKNKIAEYIDTYGNKYIYAYINNSCYKFIFSGKKIITMYEIDIEKESKKYELKFNF